MPTVDDVLLPPALPVGARPPALDHPATASVRLLGHLSSDTLRARTSSRSSARRPAWSTPVGKITEILERRTGQHGWCDTEAIGFLPQAVGLSRCQCERQPHGTSLSREAWNRPTPAPPRGHRVAPASLSRRIWSGSRRSAIVCRSSMIAGGLAHEAEDVVTEVGTRPREHGLLMAGSGCGRATFT